MQLSVDGRTETDQPSELDITRILGEFGAGEYQTVALENMATRLQVQVKRGSDGAFKLQVSDAKLNSVMQSAEHFLDSATVMDVFLSVLAGDEGWKTETMWVAMQRSVTRRKVSMSIWAFLIFDFIVTLVIAVVIYLTQVG